MEENDEQECLACEGSGDCQDCNSEGCDECEGSGSCPECDGSGIL